MNNEHAVDEDNGFVYDPRHEILEPVILRIAAVARPNPNEMLTLEEIGNFAAEITDVLDEVSCE